MANKYLLRQWQCAGPNCKHLKTDVNNWMVGVEATHAISEKRGLLLLPFDETMLEQVEEAFPICGHECATKILTRKMQEWNTAHVRT